MLRKNLIALFVLVATTTLLGCSKDEPQKNISSPPQKGRGLQDLPPLASNQLRILTDSGKPLAKAQVLIGDAVNSPFSNNFVTTDNNGVLTAPTSWNSPQSVTISASGFVRTSFLKQLPRQQNFVVHAKEGPKDLELTGNTSGFNVIDKDGIADFGIVIPSVKRLDLFNFDFGLVISPQMDSISVLGQKISLPSNITLPKQKETYIFPITLDKPTYRMFFSSMGNKSVFAGRGQFPLKPVVDDLRSGKEFYELINYFKINGGSLKSVDITGSTNNSDLTVTDINFTQSIDFQTPVFDGDQTAIALALAENQSGFYPSDFKRMDSNQNGKLITAPGTKSWLAMVLKNKNEFKAGPGKDRVSAAFVPFTSGLQPQVLPLMKNPEVISSNDIRVDNIQAPTGIKPVATYAVLSSLTLTHRGDLATVEILSHEWEVYDPEWSLDLKLPSWPKEAPLDEPMAGKMRWEVSRVGLSSSTESKNLDLGPGMFEHVTHVSHSSVDY